MALRRKKKRPKPQDDLHAWARALNDDAEAQRKPHEGVWWENLSTYAGDLWVEWDPHRNRLQENKPSGEHKVRLPINLAQPVVRTEYAKLVKNKPILDILAASNDKEDLNSAAVGDRMMQYAEKHLYLPRVRRRAVWWTLVCGQGGIFVDYDPKALGEVQVLVGPGGEPIFDERKVMEIQQYYRDQKKAPKTDKIPQGDLVVRPMSPFNYVYDMSQIYLEDAMWCAISESYDVDEVYRRWGVELEGDSDVMPGVIERRLLARSDRTGRLQMKGATSQPLVKVTRLFVRPGHRYFPDGAEIVFCDEQIIANTDLPFQHGELPLSVMGHIPYGVSQAPLSVLTQIRAPVLEVSRTASQLVENRNLMANPPWIVPKQLKLRDPIENKPGLQIEYTHMPNVPPPQPIQMPEMPMYVQNLLETFKSNILEISGQGETSQGRVPAGARSGVAIAYLQEEDDTKLGPTVQEFEEMIERSHLQILNGFAQFYDAPRTIQIYKKNSEPEVFDFMGSMLNGVAGLEVQAGSALPRSTAAKQQFILDLFDRGLEQDPVRIKQMLELGQGEPDESEVDKSQAERENRELDAGNFGEVDCLEWYNHAMHHLVHRRRMKQADFKDLPPQIQEAYRQHDEQHSVFERQAMQTQMVQQSIGGGSNGNGGPPQLNAANGMNQQTTPPQFAQQLGAGAATEAPPQ
jgi:hypothetical protein